MAHKPKLGALIHAGRHWGPNGSIALARADYERDQNLDTLIQYAVALYSAYTRAQKDRQRSRMTMVKEQFARIIEEIRVTVEADVHSMPARVLDPLATYLEWWARQNKEASERMRSAARLALSQGLKITERAPQWAHDRPLMLLTFAQLELSEGRKDECRHYLGRAEGFSKFTQDPNQRARILRKSAFLEWKLGCPLTAFSFALRAKRVPRIARDVRAKNRFF